ncbi:MAG: sugar transferase, partial [Hungatella sp.]
TVDEFQQYKPEYKSRLSMIPGITGLWQVSGRSDITDFQEVIKLDLEYIDHWSIKNDVKILLLTLKIVILGKGAK